MIRLWWRKEIDFLGKFSMDNLIWLEGNGNGHCLRISQTDWDCIVEQVWAER